MLETTGAAPYLAEVSISPALINTDSITVGPTRTPDDVLQLRVNVFAHAMHVQGKQQISSVHFAVRRDLGSSVLASGELLDDGANPDLVAGDGKFSGTAAFHVRRVEIGTYFIEVFAQDAKGFSSNTAIIPLEVIRTNRPPTLSIFQAPDTVKLANQDRILILQVKASDPDGLEDIQRVIFNSYLPDGKPSSKNPFQMYDDGDPDHGDETRGDGVYSLKVVMYAATTTIGTYRFEFQAFDKSNEGSNVITHRTTVRQ